MPTILITSMGGAGSLNLVESIRLFDTEGSIEIIGTHFSPYELAKSDLEHLYAVPKAKELDAFVEAHRQIIEAHEVDLLIANSDAEAAAFAARIDDIPCKHLLPDYKQIKAVQDKYDFYRLLHENGCKTLLNIPVPSRDGVGEAIEALDLSEGGRFWIRLRSGSGSQGATWLYTAEQAQKWMDLWGELRGMAPTDFVLAPFLPGRDFCTSVLFQQGEMCISKIYERLAYYTEDVSLSMMGSTPKTSQTVSDIAPVEASIEAIRAICRSFDALPHGLYQTDLKCDEEGRPYATEINIGRFPMTSPQFDRVGKYSQLQCYIQMALEPDKALPRGVYDLDPGWVFLRGVDLPLTIVSAARVSELESSTARSAVARIRS